LHTIQAQPQQAKRRNLPIAVQAITVDEASPQFGSTGSAWRNAWLSMRRARWSIGTGRIPVVDAQFDPAIELEQLFWGEVAAIDADEGLTLAHGDKLELPGVSAGLQELGHGGQPR
jgi:hypothetical protein